MKNKETKVKFEDDFGNIFEMLKLKEFSHKDKNYAVLQEVKSCHHDDCNCSDENLALLEVTKDSKGIEKFITIKDEKVFKEVAGLAEKLFEE